MSHPLTDAIKQQVRADFKAERPLNNQTATYLADNFEATNENLATFFTQGFTEMELDEMNITFSPQFTPKTEQRLPYMTLLGTESISEEEQEQLIATLAEEKLTCPLALTNGETVHCPVNEVILERYISRLYLDKPMVETLKQQLECLGSMSKEEKALVVLYAREPMFQKAHKASIFASLLKAMIEKKTYSEEKLTYLVDFIRSYKPKSMEELTRQLQALIDSCQDDMSNAAERSYHNEELKFQHQGGDKDHHQAEAVKENYERMIRLAQAVQADVSSLSGQEVLNA